MKIQKSTGSIVDYEEEKVLTSILRSGATKAEAEGVVSAIRPIIRDGMTTKELYELVRRELAKMSRGHAGRYSLKKAITALGPTGFPFENYIASILKAYGYRAHVPAEEIQGSCVWHEVDVVAEKDGKRFFAEAKFRSDFQGLVHLKDIMASWSRFLDLVDGGVVGTCPHFDEAWIFTNGRFTDRSRAFSKCKGMHLTGWNYPEGHTFASMVDYKALYPITVLETIKRQEIEELFKRGILLCRDLVEIEPEDLANRLSIPTSYAETLIEEASEVISMK
ncbi:MAG: hypothetical protein WC730_02535 [Patescibacteria group bacterium]|jgi:hypothetical protein